MIFENIIDLMGCGTKKGMPNKPFLGSKGTEFEANSIPDL